MKPNPGRCAEAINTTKGSSISSASTYVFDHARARQEAVRRRREAGRVQARAVPRVSLNGVVIATYARAGELKTADIDFDRPRPLRERLGREG